MEQDEEHKCLVLHQKQYILKRYGLIEANSVSTPTDLSVKLVKDDCVSKAVDQNTYQSIVEVYCTQLWLHVQILPKQWEQYQNSMLNPPKHI